MAAEPQASQNLPQPQAQAQYSAHLRKKRKKSRYLKQGYHKSERDDYRRVTARAFLSGITRDSHLLGQPSRGQAPAPEEGETPSSLIPTAPQRKRSIVPAGTAPSPPSTPVLDAQYSPMFKRLAELHIERNQQHKQVLLGTSRSLDQVAESHSHQHQSGIKTSHSVDYAEPAVHVPSSDHRDSLLHVATKWPTTAEGAIYEHQLPSKQYYDTGRSSRVVCTTHTRTVVSVFSVLPYNKSMRHDNPRERMRVRANSFSLQMDLDGIELGTTTEEVSLAFLLNSVWISSELPQTTSDPDTPSLIRKGSIRKSAEVNLVDKRSSTPTSHSRYHVNPEVFVADSAPVWLGEHRSPLYIILNYHPRFLDNEELFASRITTILTPPGYRVSIIEYARKSDIKKAVNENFKLFYPHVEVSLTKIIKIKRKLHEVAVECQLDLAAVSYAYVYLEKVVLMGKIHKSARRPVAGVCLLLAAKFVLDLKKQEISHLIDEITDSLRLSSRELLTYEFPVLVILQFSLLTPNFQARPHYDRLTRETAERITS